MASRATIIIKKDRGNQEPLVIFTQGEAYPSGLGAYLSNVLDKHRVSSDQDLIPLSVADFTNGSDYAKRSSIIVLEDVTKYLKEDAPIYDYLYSINEEDKSIKVYYYHYQTPLFKGSFDEFKGFIALSDKEHNKLAKEVMDASKG